MKYTIGQAAKATGRSKSLISKSIKDGKISATRAGTTPTSPMEIDASELFRVYSPVNTKKNEQEHTKKTLETPRGSSEIIELRVKLNAAQERIEDLKEDRDQWRLQANRLLASPATQAKEAKGAKSFFSRLFRSS